MREASRPDRDQHCDRRPDRARGHRPDPAARTAPAAQVEIQQGALEQSNVPVADAAVRLVGVMRQFEMLQRAMTLGAEMNKHAIDEVART